MKREDLPLFPSEKQIAELVLGPERAREWPQIAAVLEKQGFPKIDPLHGGRRLSSVLAWYHGPQVATQPDLPKRNNFFTVVTIAEDGIEEPDAQGSPTIHSRRPTSRNRRAGT